MQEGRLEEAEVQMLLTWPCGALQSPEHLKESRGGHPGSLAIREKEKAVKEKSKAARVFPQCRRVSYSPDEGVNVGSAHSKCTARRERNHGSRRLPRLVSLTETWAPVCFPKTNSQEGSPCFRSPSSQQASKRVLNIIMNTIKFLTTEV